MTQTENDFSYYWWGQNPYSVSLVKNHSDENHFIRIGRYYIQLDSIVSYEKFDSGQISILTLTQLVIVL